MWFPSMWKWPCHFSKTHKDSVTGNYFVNVAARMVGERTLHVQFNIRDGPVLLGTARLSRCARTARYGVFGVAT